ncbi:hypothetical protein L0U88_01335 [Flavihumibacter sp. RY-1]|uniref:Uncharacterized protein n=1 Tax=Flavihumibacter fluminis TaxID=2909236 RepID=A0ABS9BCN3_9BACT|nr:hypothetical protein [Flavihumibacter fluminis]MCF1713267.1 hypothetical protein [Flavihumibacter fluminis]
MLSILFSSFLNVYGSTPPLMRYQDKIRIREAIHISKQYSEQIWKNMQQLPFVVLLVTDSTEFLIHHPYPSSDFQLSEYDSILKTRIYFRARRFSNKLLATFPAVNGVPCIVIGLPEKTNKSSSEWTITLLHEHFHQYQFSSKGYYQDVEGLNLSRGDSTGSWQLNYPFPYKDEKIVLQFNRFRTALQEAVLNRMNKRFDRYFKIYWKERDKLKKILKPADYKYLSFQIWQEGIARYTEYKFLTFLNDYTPSTEMKSLPDYTPFPDLRDTLFKNETGFLNKMNLSADKRVCFYSIGFTEALLLDKENEQWRQYYLTDKFFIENYFRKL